MNVMMALMGNEKDDVTGKFMDAMYMNASDETVRRNFIENYTYHTRPEIARNQTMVHLWCGSKEPYAIKSHNILKKHLPNYVEEIMEEFGHGEFLMKHTADCCEKIHSTLG